MKLIRSTEFAYDIECIAVNAAKAIGFKFGKHMDQATTRAIYKFCKHWHKGQDSNLYRMMSSMKVSGDVVLEADEEEIYNALVLHFTGCDMAAKIAWNNRVRATRACRALHAYVDAKDEKADESDIQDLISDLMHLKALIYEGSDEAPVKMLEMASANFFAKHADAPSKMEDGTDAPQEMPDEHDGIKPQEELAEFMSRCKTEIEAIQPPRWKE